MNRKQAVGAAMLAFALGGTAGHAEPPVRAMGLFVGDIGCPHPNCWARASWVSGSKWTANRRSGQGKLTVRLAD